MQGGRSAELVEPQSVKPSLNLQNGIPTGAARRVTILVVSRLIRNMLKQALKKNLLITLWPSGPGTPPGFGMGQPWPSHQT